MSSLSAHRAPVVAALIVLSAFLALWALSAATRERVARESLRYQMRAVADVLANVEYDNDPIFDTLTVRDKEHLGGDAPRRVFRAYKNSRPAGLAIETVAPGGYSGDIALLIGVHADGTVSGVRVTAHRETAGLGDRIEVARDDWILGFGGRRLDTATDPRWRVRRDGGDFDQFTGATVTPRAVVEAVRKALIYFDAHAAPLFAPASSAT